MTRFIYDQFAKDYLEELLAACGEVSSSKKVALEVQEIDVVFTPNPTLSENRRALCLLGRMATNRGIFEPFHNPIKSLELWDCLMKLGVASRQLHREANRDRTLISESELPKLWMLIPIGFELGTKERRYGRYGDRPGGSQHETLLFSRVIAPQNRFLRDNAIASLYDLATPRKRSHAAG